jgi:hypothetical protein
MYQNQIDPIDNQENNKFRFPMNIQPTSSFVVFFNIDVGLDLDMINQSEKEEEQQTVNNKYQQRQNLSLIVFFKTVIALKANKQIKQMNN